MTERKGKTQWAQMWCLNRISRIFWAAKGQQNLINASWIKCAGNLFNVFKIPATVRDKSVETPFLHSRHTYPLPLSTPTPSPSPSNQCCILDPQVFLLLQTTVIDSGGEGIYGLWKELNSKWIKRLIKAPVLNKCVNYFCLWL